MKIVRMYVCINVHPCLHMYAYAYVLVNVYACPYYSFYSLMFRVIAYFFKR